MDAAQGHRARGDVAEGWADRNACAAGSRQQGNGIQYGTCARPGMINTRGADSLGLAIAIPATSPYRSVTRSNPHACDRPRAASDASLFKGHAAIGAANGLRPLS